MSFEQAVNSIEQLIAKHMPQTMSPHCAFAHSVAHIAAAQVARSA